MEAARRMMFEQAREGGGWTDMEFVLDRGKVIRGHMADGEVRVHAEDHIEQDARGQR
jgi:hypothetical protein